MVGASAGKGIGLRMIVAWGSHVGLRPFEDVLTDAEIERVYDWSRDQDVLRWSGGTPTELTLEEFRDRLRSDRRYAPSDRRVFFIVTRGGELIGRTGCFAIDWELKQAELGIVIGEPAYWGQGYGRDAVRTLLRHLFKTTQLESIHLYTFADNVRAQHCFAACGFVTRGQSQRFSPDIGEFDGIEMEITREQFIVQEAQPSSPSAPIPEQRKKK